MLLSELANNETANIIDFSKVDTIIQKRLLQLGVKRNCQVCLVRKLPFGGPCMIQSGGQCISLRISEAQLIEVSQK